jgi:hypothetical protein
MDAGARANALGVDEARLGIGIDVAVKPEDRDLWRSEHGGSVEIQ